MKDVKVKSCRYVDGAVDDRSSFLIFHKLLIIQKMRGEYDGWKRCCYFVFVKQNETVKQSLSLAVIVCRTHNKN